jgi:hypothetical protein
LSRIAADADRSADVDWTINDPVVVKPIHSAIGA